MNSTQTNKLAAYAAIEGVLQANPEIANVLGLPAKVAMFSAKVGEINSLARTQTQPIEGKTARRNELLRAMAGTAVDVATVVATYADEQQLTELARLVKVTESDFARARQSHRLWLAQRILDTAQTVLPQLASHGLTEEALTELQARIQAAQEGLREPRTTVAAKKAATIRLVVLFADVDALLEGQIDRMVFPLRKTSPEFYAAYRVARSIVDRPGGRKSVPEAPAVPASTTPATSATPTMPPPAAEKLAA